MESIGYMLLYFLKGSLPWMGLPGKGKKEKFIAIGKVKSETSLTDLCKGQPIELYHYMEWCRLLEFEEQPDYDHMRNLFEDCMKRHNLSSKVNNYVWKQKYFNKDKSILKTTIVKLIQKMPARKDESTPKGKLILEERRRTEFQNTALNILNH